ncbi:MAG: SH3 domain-containing protein, partial [Clostridia bacterium]|nr:SH3 domain-containing protein [Clostridia bacterium]
MKRIFSILLITALVIGLMPMMGTVALAEEYATITSTNGYGVRLREGPSKAYNPLGTYDVGTTVQVLQSGTTWSQIVVGGKTGWMLNEFLIFGTTGNGGTSSGSAPSGDTAYVWSDNGLRVWLRAKAGGQRLQLYSAGTPLTVIKRGSDWSHVYIQGSYGYMSSYYIDFGDKSSAKEETTTPTGGALKSVSLNYNYPVVGDVMEATIKPDGAKVKYSWKVDGVVMGTEPTFSVLTRYANQTISLTVTGTSGWTGTLTKTAKEPVQISKGLKSVSLSKASPVVGNTLSAVLQPSSAVVEYSWRVGGVEVSSEATYTVQSSDIGKIIQLKVSGVDGYEGSVACSAADPVVSDKDVQSVKLNKTNPKVGETISATIVPSGAKVKYEWSVDGEVVSSAATYAPTRLQLGKQVKLTVTGTSGYVGSVSAITGRVVTNTITGVTVSNTSPKTGNKIWANITPANASATYQWYSNDAKISGATSAELQVTDAYLGKQLSVEVEGTGVYASKVKSAKTAKVTNGKVITGVTIDNTNPVVGETIKANVAPSSAKNDCTYIWMIDNEVWNDHSASYNVKASDLGKVIRVKAIGANGWTGEAYSDYTKPVASKTDLKGVTIRNQTAGNNAANVQPETGSVLVAKVEPSQAHDRGMVEYTWTIDGTKVGSNTNTYTIDEKDAGKRITVTVKGKTDYTGSQSATTLDAVKRTPLNVTLKVAKPVEGITPTSSVSVNKVCKGSIEWLQNGLPAELDNYGRFLPNAVYTAKITLTLENGYTMTNATVKVPGATIESIKGNVVYAVFPVTSEQQVTDFHIAEVKVPIVGQKAVTSFKTEQYNGIVTWETNHIDTNNIFQSVDTYVAYIGLTANTGYSLNGLQDNIFTVSGASSVSYDSTSKVVTAKFSVSRKLSVTADKSEVFLDGYNSRIVQCAAELSNYIGDFDDIKWEIVEATVDGTSIDEKTGQLVIGMYEAVDRKLTIRATVNLTDAEGKKKKYVGTTSITLSSGTDTDTAIRVNFSKATTTVERGSKAYFEAKVSNSLLGSNIFAIWGNGNSELLGSGTGVLDTSATKFKDVKQIVVKAISNEDHSVVASVLVDITEPPTPLSLYGIMLISEEDSSLAALDVPVEGAPAAAGEEAGIATMEIMDEQIPAYSGEETGIATMEIMDEQIPAYSGEELAAEPTIEVTLTSEEEEVEETPAATEEEAAVEPTIEVTLTSEEEEVEETPAATEEETAVEPTIEVTLTSEEEEVEETPAATEEEAAVEPTIEVTLSTEEEEVEETPA